MTDIQLICTNDLRHFKTLVTADNKFVACKFIRDPNGVTHLEVVNGVYFRIRERQGIIKIQCCGFQAIRMRFACVDNIFHFVGQDARFRWHVLNAMMLI